jgi:predicted SAM-dependent methyltransferase
VKLNLGCGDNIMEDHTNVDKFHPAADVRADMSDLPFEDGAATHILCSHVLEHIPFQEEEAVWTEMFRVLKWPEGELVVEVPDFEWWCHQFLIAEDDFISFWQSPPYHYFGHGLTLNQRWGAPLEWLFGNQRHEGEFHCNAYTAKKLLGIGRLYNRTLAITFSATTVESPTQEEITYKNLKAIFSETLRDEINESRLRRDV